MGDIHVSTAEKPLETSEERRRHPRFIKRLPVKFFIDNECLTSLSSDLSESGLFLRTNRGTTINCVVSIQLFLPSNAVSCIKGIVRRTVRTPFSEMKNGMGIEIIEKDEAYGHFIQSIRGGTMDKNAPPALPVVPCAVSEISDDEPKNTVAEERRQHKRINIELRGMSGKMPFTSYLNIIDISTGGISFEADRRLNMGRSYTLSIIHDKQTFTVKGTIIWSIIRKSKKDDRGNVIPVYKAGMKFSDESKDQIREFIPLIEIAMKKQRKGPLLQKPYDDPSQRFRKN
jgi:hypothetical protein